MQTAAEVVNAVPTQVWVALAFVVLGVLVGYLVSAVLRRLLVRVGVPDAIEGTSFERTARDFGTSTVVILSRLARYFVVGLAVLVALSVVGIDYVDQLGGAVAAFFPQLFAAALILIIGLVVADKVELLVAEQLRGIKLERVDVVPLGAKYSVLFLATLIALSQIGVATGALVVSLGAYFLAVIVLTAVAFKQMLASGAAGIYLLLHQPYGIGDEVRVGDTRGIVCEMDLFVTHVESDEEEVILPNDKVFERGVARLR
ncbi:mechanosensitive ion channel domain-containing protein [Salinigranum marinum]|uniref:mechanosensitive ion channel domain-containing protein n=1 Tax=Salinigranum marinum TaxID=1515595 RepID=UPI002989F41A|nr:mechanosensitive ion channel domain-containing protein [Salinigranum marinum]